MLQSDIAAVEHLSRPSVSRLLTEARERGVVQFRIGPPVDRVPELETELQRRAPLHACIVSTGKPRALYANSSRLGYVAARYLESQLSHVRLLGVASSRSLSGVVESMVQAHRRDLTVIDLLGCLPGGRADRDAVPGVRVWTAVVRTPPGSLPRGLVPLFGRYRHHSCTRQLPRSRPP
ncbi:deoxyribonucleoside regulator [Arthrobacter sp. Hiyo8]|nr:deoxyribonucleoside regulator [Arthrobacter sp. Hiyo8]